MPAPTHESVVPRVVSCEPTHTAIPSQVPAEVPVIRAVRYPARGRVAATLPDNTAASRGPAVSPPRHDEGPATARHRREAHGGAPTLTGARSVSPHRVATMSCVRVRRHCTCSRSHGA